VSAVAAASESVLEAVGEVVVGGRRTLRLALAAVLAGGHVLLEDVPGLGKTLLARSLAQALGLEFRRLQCTPDMLPADVTGSFLYDPATRDFTFRHVLATANPVEYEGTYPLPEAQLDRFLLRLDVGYPPADEEIEVLRRRLARQREETEVAPVVDAAGLAELQAEVEKVDVDEDILRYCVDLVTATRAHPAVEVGASPRGSLALTLVARALSVVDGRDHVLPEDVKECAVAALAHRLVLRPETWTSGLTGVQVVTELLGKVPGPASTR
jgi:MoxR-like ATPase